MFTLVFPRSTVVAAMFLGIGVLPLSVGAQDRSSLGHTPQAPSAVSLTTANPANQAQAPGPRLAPAGIHVQPEAGPLRPAPNTNLNAGSNLAMMGVGAAGVVVGLLVGGDGGTLLALGGGVIGLIGLYRYIR